MSVLDTRIFHRALLENYYQLISSYWGNLHIQSLYPSLHIYQSKAACSRRVGIDSVQETPLSRGKYQNNQRHIRYNNGVGYLRQFSSSLLSEQSSSSSHLQGVGMHLPFLHWNWPVSHSVLVPRITQITKRVRIEIYSTQHAPRHPCSSLNPSIVINKLEVAYP